MRPAASAASVASAASPVVINVTAQSGSPVVLTVDQLRGGEGKRWDFNWKRMPDLSLWRKQTKCDNGRCELLSNGSLRFSQVWASDSGNYKLAVFNHEGVLQVEAEFHLTVEGESDIINPIKQPPTGTISSLTSLILI